jgi:predicted DCC family thiol-disulfide oxidoreductase YuxK
MSALPSPTGPSIFQPAVYARHAWQRWTEFWFAPQPVLMLDVIRIGVGLTLLGLYASLGTQLLDFYADGGWVDAAALAELNRGLWAHSLLTHLATGWPQQAFIIGAVLSMLAFTIGWQTRWVKWLVLAAHLSLLHRNPLIAYGVDNITASLLWLLCLAPIGRSLSLDRWREVRRAKLVDLSNAVPTAISARAGLCLRLIQVQMVVFFFLAGATKLQGASWWHGHAVWFALTNYEYANIPLGWLASQFWIVNLLTYATIVLELAYPFLVWGPRRGWLLAEAIALHVGIAVMLGLYAFSFVMVFAHLAFVRASWLAQWREAWQRRFGGMEMIYDGHCGFCKRSMAAFLAFDGLSQIAVRDFRRNPSPVVSNAELEQALYLVTADGRRFAGFEAYRHAVLRVPALWWMLPLFYLPWLSRAVGSRVYHWVATHRNVISDCGTDAASACSIPLDNRAES